MKLRWRIALHFGIVLGLLEIVLGAAYYLELNHILPEQTADRLHTQVKHRIAAYVSRGGTEGLLLTRTAHDLATDLTFPDVTAVVLDAAGRVLAPGKTLPGEQDPAPPRPELVKEALEGEGFVSSLRSFKGGREMVLYIPLRASAGSPAIGALQTH